MEDLGGDDSLVKGYISLGEDIVSFSVPISDGLKLLVIPIAGDITPSSDLTCVKLYTYKHTTYTHTIKNKIFLKIE